MRFHNIIATLPAALLAGCLEGEAVMTNYHNQLTPITTPVRILGDFPEYVEPLAADTCFQAPPLVNETDGALQVRAWRYWYNARGIILTDNRLDARATAVVMVHPWGIDDGHGMQTPEPAGVAFFCTKAKNAIGFKHMREVVDPFLKAMRPQVGLIGYSLPGVEDDIRKLLYASIGTPPSALNVAEGEQRLRRRLAEKPFLAQPLLSTMELDTARPLQSYFDKSASTDAGDHYNGVGYWNQPMPLSAAIAHAPADRVFYDAEGYPKVREYLKKTGIRHILLTGYCTDMCVISTTCGYENFCKDFNVFLVGDATLATFPGSRTPKYATQTALANAALAHMVTQVRWVRFENVEKR